MIASPARSSPAIWRSSGARSRRGALARRKARAGDGARGGRKIRVRTGMAGAGRVRGRATHLPVYRGRPRLGRRPLDGDLLVGRTRNRGARGIVRAAGADDNLRQGEARLRRYRCRRGQRQRNDDEEGDQTKYPNCHCVLLHSKSASIRRPESNWLTDNSLLIGLQTAEIRSRGVREAAFRPQIGGKSPAAERGTPPGAGDFC